MTIAKMSLDINEVIRMMRNGANLYCNINSIPPINVRLQKQGDNHEYGAFAWFNFKEVSIIMANNIPSRLSLLEPKERVRQLNSALMHELIHYKQYLRLVRENRLVSKTDFNENEAIIEGRRYASLMLEKYTKEEINPERKITAKMIQLKKGQIFRCDLCNKKLEQGYIIYDEGKMWHVGCFQEARQREKAHAKSKKVIKRRI